MTAVVPLHRDRHAPIDPGEAGAILRDAARAMARRGWSAHRLARQFGLPLTAAQRLVEEASSVAKGNGLPWMDGDDSAQGEVLLVKTARSRPARRCTG